MRYLAGTQEMVYQYQKFFATTFADNNNNVGAGGQPSIGPCEYAHDVHAVKLIRCN
jgi:hypothetical protein